MIPLRSAHIIHADPAAVERVLWSAEIWSRTMAGSGLATRTDRILAGAAGPTDRLTPGTTLVLTTWHRGLRRPARHHSRRREIGTFRVERPAVGAQVGTRVVHGPTMVGIDGALRGWSVRTSSAGTGGGCLVTIEATNPARRWRPGLRAGVLGFQRLFLGLAALLSRDEPPPPVVVVAGVIVEDGRVLAARRRYPPELAGFWECPGGKVEPGESEQQALARELLEEIAVQVEVGPRVGPDIRISPALVLHAYVARITAGRPIALDHDDIAWISTVELPNVNWLPGDLPLMEAVQELMIAQTGMNGTPNSV